MKLTSISDVNPSRLAVEVVRKRGCLKIQSVTHGGEALAFVTPVMTAPFGITRFASGSDLKLTLELDKSDEEHNALREMLGLVHEQLSKCSDTTLTPLIKTHDRYGDRFELKLDCKELSEFKPIKDLEGNIVDDIPALARVKAAIHVEYVWHSTDMSGIKLKCKLLQLVALKQDLREPSPEIDDADDAFAVKTTEATPSSPAA